jgi:hypothetical protein
MIAQEDNVLSRIPVTGGLVAATLAIGCMSGADDHALQVRATDDGLEATLGVGDETVTVRSHLHDGVRDIAVTGADGASYAEWHTRLSNLDTFGSYGARPFGRVENAATDGDTSAWLAVLQSHVGDVLGQVSSAAGAAAQTEDQQAIAQQLTAISLIHPSLEQLTRAPGAPETVASVSCWFGNTTAEEATCDSEGQFHVIATTTRPDASCTRTYYVQLYRDSPWTYLSGDGTGDGNPSVAEVWRLESGHGFRSYSSKHWDSLNPGSPIWHDHGVTCP